ncbi:MAG: hypothetical protein U1E49_04620 [Hyphomicrobiaceae bacterium]
MRHGLIAAMIAAALAAGCSQTLPSAGTTAAVAPAAPATPLAATIAGRSFTFSSGGTVTETFLADGTGEWRRPSGRTGAFTWTLTPDGTLCRVYAPSPATEGQKAWEGGTWCGAVVQVPEGLQYTDQKSGSAGLLKEVAPGAT